MARRSVYKRSGESAGKSRQAHWEHIGKGGSVEPLQDFVATKDTTKKRRIVDVLSRSHLARDIVVVGELCIEMAKYDPRNASDWLERGRQSLGQTIVACSVSNIYVSRDVSRAKQLLDTMPHYFSVFVEGRLPVQKWSERMYANIGQTAVSTLQSFESHPARPTNPIDKKARRDLKGLLSEQAVHLLALRAGQEIGCESWAIAPSLYSEDNHARNSKGSFQRSWDFTVQTQFGTKPIEDRFLVQAKSQRHQEQTRRDFQYTDDITMLYVGNDLSIGEEQLARPGDIVCEIFAEQTDNDQIAKAKLDLRQERLLDVLG